MAIHIDDNYKLHTLYKLGFRVRVPLGTANGYGGHVVFIGFDNEEEFHECVKFIDENAAFRYNIVWLCQGGKEIWNSVGKTFTDEHYKYMDVLKDKEW